ncbi:hypothetical protein GIB67_031824 [Kingdonia uniflora]|uniref:Plant heme peroxidase family profile domain-containing protein n=1 Tax=Kingdonia uniflora TaxID=39325 RepID=A0A7J7L4M7_9MAGN|nr:hypothetical protein GIB67_031822 [Kingdonia uniflora]KAF6137545.1 hypothetical protein GIB67_031824 [Kingdonia uniflora]
MFNQNGFDERETVSLLGGYNIGQFHSEFIRERLYNFSGTGKPDGSISEEYLVELRKICKRDEELNSSPTPSRSASPSGITQDRETAIQSGQRFDSHYYQNFLDNNGTMVSEDGGTTEAVVRAYASDRSAFRRDFARSMIKMSSLLGKPGSRGPIRVNCSRLFSSATI